MQHSRPELVPKRSYTMRSSTRTSFCPSVAGSEEEISECPVSDAQRRLQDYRSHRVYREDTNSARNEVSARNFRCMPHVITECVSTAYDRLNFNALCAAPTLFDWKWQSNLNGFAMFTSQESQEKQRVFHVLVYGTVKNCSVREMKHTLRAPTDATFNALMTAMFGDRYIHGFVHQSEVIGLKTNNSVHENQDANSLDEECDVFVRSCRWTKPHLLSRNEEWRYLDFVCDEDLEGQKNGCPGFANLFATVNTEDDGISEMQKASTDKESAGRRSKPSKLGQRRGIYGGYLVREEENSLRSVRVQFYARCTAEKARWYRPGEKSKSDFADSVGKSKIHMLQMAQGTTRLPEVIRRRRLGFQIFADINAFKPRNKYCTCCTKRLSMFGSKQKQCNLCGNAICEACSTMDHVEIHDIISSIRVCERCLQLVDECDYDSLDGVVHGTPSIQAMLERGTSSASLMVDMLQEAYDNVDDTKKDALVSVIKSMLAFDKGNHSPAEDEALAQRLTCLGATTNGDNNETESLKEALKNRSLVDDLPVQNCVLAHSKSRNYPIDYRNRDSYSKVPTHPVPPNEQERIEVIRKYGFRDFAGDLEELKILCGLAAKEMQCEAGAITILDAKEQHIVVSNKPCFHDVVMPRDQSICSHILMDHPPKPLLVPSTSADIRFKNFENAVKRVIHFYFGYPITSEEGTVVGALCCFDSKTRSVTNSQYSIVKRLADTVSSILSEHAKYVHATKVA
uniref:GAF domaincontaining protein putative n=1 Tax=Albugo laibachii Nc14 TaxID=890382 RepID=F0WST5_9STRA|nr:GAF domaincontaining protein putative [Albugo laibachii Nc14]|eukprot:CCA24413.1 GAF domaincontaining protein putative [Albugo laibachii Nc14]